MAHPISKFIKICGLKTKADIEAANASKVDAIGFVHFPPSPRSIDLATAHQLKAALDNAITTVSLLVNPDDQLIDEVLRTLAPDVIQLHGSETPERVTELKKRSGCDIWKAVGIASRDDLETLNDYSAANALLLDTKKDGEWGGTGERFDWSLLTQCQLPRPIILAGGITVENVAEAIALVNPDGVDVSSGVEATRGQKDPQRIGDFVIAARQAFSKTVSCA